MYSGKMIFNLWPISTPGKLKSMAGHGSNRTYDLWNVSPMLCQLSHAIRSLQVFAISILSLVLQNQRNLNVAAIAKVAGSIPSLASHIIQLPGVDIDSE